MVAGLEWVGGLGDRDGAVGREPGLVHGRIPGRVERSMSMSTELLTGRGRRLTHLVVLPLGCCVARCRFLSCRLLNTERGLE